MASRTGADALGAAIRGTVCVRAKRLPRDFAELVAAARDARVQLIICGLEPPSAWTTPTKYGASPGDPRTYCVGGSAKRRLFALPLGVTPSKRHAACLLPPSKRKVEMSIQKRDLEQELSPLEFADFLATLPNIRKQFGNEHAVNVFVADVRRALFGNASDDGKLPTGSKHLPGIDSRWSLWPGRKVKCALCVAEKTVEAVAIVAFVASAIPALATEGLVFPECIPQIVKLLVSAFSIAETAATIAASGGSPGQVAKALCPIC